MLSLELFYSLLFQRPVTPGTESAKLANLDPEVFPGLMADE